MSCYLFECRIDTILQRGKNYFGPGQSGSLTYAVILGFQGHKHKYKSQKHMISTINCMNTHCLHGDTYVTPLYCIWGLSWYNMWPVGTGSHTRSDVCILPYALDKWASGTRVRSCYNWSHVVSWLTSNTTVELFILLNFWFLHILLVPLQACLMEQ